MKSFQDYLGLKETSGYGVAREVVDIRLTLSKNEASSFVNVMQAIEKILSGPDAMRFLNFINQLSDENIEYNVADIKRVANKLTKSSAMNQGLGDATGEDPIARNAGDDASVGF